MMSTTVRIKGDAEFRKDFTRFYQKEAAKENSPYDFKSLETPAGAAAASRLAIAEAPPLRLTISAALLQDLLVDYIKEISTRKGHPVTCKISGPAELLVITLNNLPFKEIEKLIREFKGEIAEIEHCR